MTTRHKFFYLATLFSMSAVLGSFFAQSSAAQQPSKSKSTATGIALSTLLNVRRAPVAKGMGLFQVNFLDALDSSQGSMQLAIVVDTTESMTDELQPIRENLPNLIKDLGQLTDNRLEVALISYADLGDGEKPAKILSSDFLSDTETIDEVVEQLQPSTGEPFFPEAVDLGVVTALKDLNW